MATDQRGLILIPGGCTDICAILINSSPCRVYFVAYIGAARSPEATGSYPCQQTAEEKMTRPTTEELESALAMAAQMRDKDLDPFLIAKSLLSENYRARCLQEVLEAADRYVNLGMADSERTRLIRAIEKAKNMEDYNTRQRQDNFGLE
jgi:hypothetical protein